MSANCEIVLKMMFLNSFSLKKTKQNSIICIYIQRRKAINPHILWSLHQQMLNKWINNQWNIKIDNFFVDWSVSVCKCLLLCWTFLASEALHFKLTVYFMGASELLYKDCPVQPCGFCFVCVPALCIQTYETNNASLCAFLCLLLPVRLCAPTNIHLL